jgi:hypothetical protein
MSVDEAAMTPEQVARQAAESDPSPYYADGRPKYHRHFADDHIHRDHDCTRPAGSWRRVYVFDWEDLDEHETRIRANERAKAYDDVVAIAKAQRRNRG